METNWGERIGAIICVELKNIFGWMVCRNVLFIKLADVILWNFEG